MIVDCTYIYGLIKILCKSKKASAATPHSLNLEGFFIKPVFPQVYELISDVINDNLYGVRRYWESGSK